MNDINLLQFLGGLVVVFWGLVFGGLLSCMIRKIRGGGGKIY